MLHIIQSNRMEALQAQLHTIMQQVPLSGVFSKEVILVQSPGMSQWLKLGASRALGVAAQLDFPLPSSYIWQLYQQFLPQVPKHSPYNKANMTWKLVEILPKHLDKPLFLPLASYLEVDESQLKLFSLCEKIADVFDQYLMYRPTWLEQWESGVDELIDVDVSIAPWQPELWRLLVAHTDMLGQSPYHRANMHQQLLSALEQAKPEQLPERICLFGLSAIPNSQLEIFQALAQKTSVLLFFFNPSTHYWGDLVDEKTQAKINAKFAKKPSIDAQEGEYFNIGNPLLSSWGKLGRDYLEQLLQLDAKWVDCFVEDFADNALGKIQKEIYELAFKGESLVEDTHWFINDEGKLAITEQDDSLYLQDCHTPLREVECLHDHLLRLFHEDPSLTPKDIIVMMPDVANYSPYIEAVFGGAQGARSIPYSLADLAIEQEKPVITSFVTLVDLPFSRFGVSEILDLLAVEPIAQQYEVTADEFTQFRYWLDQVGIRWGVDDTHKAEHDLPTVSLNTWQLGLQRLLLGVATSDESHAFMGIYPSDQVEGMATDSLTKLIKFISDLVAFKHRLEKESPLQEKVAHLSDLITCFYHPDAEQSWDLQTLGNVIESLQEHYDNLDSQGPVTPQVLSYCVKQGVAQKGVGQRFLVGAVNFCTLMPMRAVPFKVVCMLGLNDSDYPRTVQPIGFDLVAHAQPKKGDRSRKLDDRYLFLEALLSARKQLVLSYVGRSCYNNEPQVPSILVSELLEYFDRGFTASKDGKPILPSQFITWQAPLQPFDPLHYQTGRVQSFNPVWLPLTSKAEQQNEVQAPLNIELAKEVELSQFIRAILKPQATFYQNSVGLRLPQIELEEKDEEPFTLDTLQRYQYLDELLEEGLEGVESQDEQKLQRGSLPQQNVGKIQLAQLKRRIEPLTKELKGQLKAKREPIEVNIQLGGYILQGWLDSLYGDTQVLYRTASIKPKDKIRAFVLHCVAHCIGERVTTLVYGLDDYVKFEPLDQDTARAQLQVWFEFYQNLLTQPVPFFPTSSYEYVKTQDFAKANGKFKGGQYIGFGDVEDPYVALDFSSLEDIKEAFIALSGSLLDPLHKHAQEVPYANA